MRPIPFVALAFTLALLQAPPAFAEDEGFVIISGNTEITRSDAGQMDVESLRQGDIAVSIAAVQPPAEPLYYRIGGVFRQVPVGVGRPGEWFPVRGMRRLTLYRHMPSDNGQSGGQNAQPEDSGTTVVQSTVDPTLSASGLSAEQFVEVATVEFSGNGRDYLLVLPSLNGGNALREPALIDLSLNRFPLGSAMLVNLTQLPLIFKFNDKIREIAPLGDWIIPVGADSSQRVRRVDLRVGVTVAGTGNIMFSNDTPFITGTRLLKVFYIDQAEALGTILGNIELRDVGPVGRQ